MKQAACDWLAKPIAALGISLCGRGSDGEGKKEKRDFMRAVAKALMCLNLLLNA